MFRVNGDHHDLGLLDQRIEFAPARLAFPGLDYQSLSIAKTRSAPSVWRSPRETLPFSCPFCASKSGK
jgi:hypothetical protein